MESKIKEMTATPPARRHFLQRCATAAAVFAAPGWAQTHSVRLGTTCDSTGQEKGIGGDLVRGATAYFNALNKTGGIHGAKVELVTADDQFKPELAKANALAFQGDKTILGILSPLGTRPCSAIIESVHDIAVVGPVAGAAAVRANSPPNVFWVRASFDAEIEKLINTAVTLGITRIGIVHPKDPLGLSILASFQKTMAEVKLTPAIIVTTATNTSSDFGPAAKAIAKVQPQVVIMVLSGVAPVFVKALRDAGGTSTVYGLSNAASAANIAAMGDKARGVSFAMIVPSPISGKNTLVRNYQADMLASGWKDFTHFGLEAYVNARVMIEGLRRAGNGVTRASLVTALDSITGFDLGGMTVSYGNGKRLGSNFVDVGVVGIDGRIMT
jgi:branched-chain amino acid transport system substrate-binding protein